MYHPALLYEYMPYSLKEVMNSKCIIEELTNTEKVKIIIDIAYGLKFLQENRCIMHRNIKPENILISRKFHAKIGDFTWAISTDDQSERTKKEVKSTYDAPELSNSILYNEKIDQYSFGKLIYFILSNGKEPPTEINENTMFSQLAFDIMIKCCAKSPDDRPSFPHIIESMENENFDLLPNININNVKERMIKLDILEKINNS